MMKRERNPWVFVMLLLVGVVIGGVLGEFLSQFPYLAFLKYGQTFGIDLSRPLYLDLSIIKLSFAAIFNINIASIIGVVISIIIFNKL